MTETEEVPEEVPEKVPEEVPEKISEVVPVKSPSKRHQNRIAAMQFIYMVEMNPPDIIKITSRDFFESQDQPRDFYSFAEELVHGSIEKFGEIDEVIKAKAVNWSFERIAKVDLAILRLAAYELLYREDIPPVVSINEAIDLSKEFSSDDSRRFVNGILDEIKKTLDRPARSAKK